MITAEQARQRSLESNNGVRDALFKIDQAIKKSCEQHVNNFYAEISGFLKNLSRVEIDTVEGVLRNLGYDITYNSVPEVLVKW